MTNKSVPETAMAGIMLREISEGKLTIELFRDLAWDERIARVIPYILSEITARTNNILIETSVEDKKLAELLYETGCKFLLGYRAYQVLLQPLKRIHSCHQSPSHPTVQPDIHGHLISLF